MNIVMKKKYTKEQIEEILVDTIEKIVEESKKIRTEALKQIEDEDETKKEIFNLTQELKDTALLSMYMHKVIEKL